MALNETLEQLGFTRDENVRDQILVLSLEADLSHNGEYSVGDVFVRGECVVVVEQNQAPEDLGGMKAVVTHPPLAIIESPKGRVAFNPTDVKLAEVLVSELG